MTERRYPEPERRFNFWPRPAAAHRARLVRQRNALIDGLSSKGISDLMVLQAMRETPRHVFIPPDVRTEAYSDKALPIGWEQTISQPYIVALMTQSLGLRGTERVLEIGTGSGYQTAVLSSLAHTVYTIEIQRDLSGQARQRLTRLGRTNIVYRVGDGWRGWPELAPFDAILVTAAPRTLPIFLLDQLCLEGRLVVPVGEQHETQTLWRCRKTSEHGWRQDSLGPVLFVPMTGEGQSIS